MFHSYKNKHRNVLYCVSKNFVNFTDVNNMKTRVSTIEIFEIQNTIIVRVYVVYQRFFNKIMLNRVRLLEFPFSAHSIDSRPWKKTKNKWSQKCFQFSKYNKFKPISVWKPHNFSLWYIRYDYIMYLCLLLRFRKLENWKKYMHRWVQMETSLLILYHSKTYASWVTEREWFD